MPTAGIYKSSCKAIRKWQAERPARARTAAYRGETCPGLRVAQSHWESKQADKNSKYCLFHPYHLGKSSDSIESLWCVDTGKLMHHGQEDKHNLFEDNAEGSWRQTYFYCVMTLLGTITQWNPNIMVQSDSLQGCVYNSKNWAWSKCLGGIKEPTSLCNHTMALQENTLQFHVLMWVCKHLIICIYIITSFA